MNSASSSYLWQGLFLAAITIGLASAVYVLTLTWTKLIQLPTATIWVAALIYLTSHVLRALRLALLSMDMLGISGRTAALMHFATALFALVFPFKAGELLRLHQLWQLGGTAIYAVIVLLIDRMYDSLFLIPVLLILLMQSSAPPVLTLFTLLAAFVPLVVVVIGPKLLSEVQRYVLVHHNNPRTLDLLPQIDTVRVLVVRAASVARRRAPELSLLSLLIWLSELLFCLILVNGSAGWLVASAGQAVELLGTRLVAPWWDLGAQTLAGQALGLSILALLVPWPFLAYLYVRRQKGEPRRVPSDWAAHMRTEV